jgi:hypothetical protein
MVFREVRIDHSDELRYIVPPDVPHNQIAGLLYYPLEAEGVLTTFRKMVLNYIYRTALGLSAGRVESARVSLSGELDEEDSFHLDLTLTVNTHWGAAQVLTQEILDRVSEWSKDWLEEDQEDYGRWIYFGVIPTEL